MRVSKLKDKLSALSKNIYVILIEEHPFISSFIGTGLSFLINFLFDYCVFVYYKVYSLYWNIDMQYIEINRQNTIFSFVENSLIGFVGIYVSYLWSRALHTKEKVRKGTIIYFVVSIAISLLIPIVGWGKYPILSALSSLVLIVDILLFGLLSFTYCTFYMSSKEYSASKKNSKPDKEQENGAPDIEKSKKVKKPIYQQVAVASVLILALITAYMAFSSWIVITQTRYFERYTDTGGQSYVVLSRKNERLYLTKCIEKSGVLIISPNEHKVISDDNANLTSMQTYFKIANK